MAEETKKEPQEIVKMPAWAAEIIKKQGEMEAELQKKDATLAEQAKKIEMFESMAGKNAIQSWHEARKDHSLKFVHFKVWNGKPIIGWGPLDYSQFVRRAPDAQGENILKEVHYKDGSIEKINLSIFNNIKELVHAKLVNFGTRESTIEFEDGEQKVIKNEFLNA